jgi:hypothetical protein
MCVFVFGDPADDGLRMDGWKKKTHQPDVS